MDIFVNQLSFVNKSVPKPNIDGVKTHDWSQTTQPHLFLDLSDSGVTIALTLANMPLGESPFAIRINHHGKKNTFWGTLKHKPSCRDLCSMTLRLSLTSSGRNRAPLEIGGR